MNYSMNRALTVPITTVTDANIDRVQKIIVADASINTSLEAQLKALFKTVFTSIHIYF